MKAARRIGLVGGAGLLLLALGAAQRPAMLSRASGGLWEISGAPGSSEPVRICLADLGVLAQYEHRKAKCTRHVIRETDSFTEINYSCAGGGFGRTRMGLLTPRSLRVETQGISDNAPFHYILQARRVGDC
jgi:hypothetical protein